MDDGSHRSYIEKSLVAELNLSPSGTEVLSQGLFGGGISPSMDYPRIVRVTAWILRFCRNIRVNSDKLTKELSYEEIQRAEEALIRLIQSEWSSDIREKYTQTIKFYEENKILKVRSRLILGEDPEDFVRPTVLPDHPIVRRLIDYIHQKLHHAGGQTTLSHLREWFWIPRSRRAIKPSDFIQDIKGTEVLDLDIVDAKHLRKPIRYLQNLRYQLCQRFQKEYLFGFHS
ncbi:integrase_H2C2 domain-containing protein [Nephila pilipes]|uniref:Integrase_H2C2 domain-containing protein n=1 Tax=Nephila pilipes TaxID=299642 RepID=A0A8X6U6N9_NEPPI|nr:integrase_H2C2 domain-containing protein [Nephila pilipes]